MQNPDLVIVGGGIVGIATAMTIGARHPNLQITVVEAEADFGQHQTGHNSGVLHSGIYYKPGSIKAIHCLTGKVMMEEFCTEHSVAWDKCGKVVVATCEQELPRLDRIAERATENGVAFERINTDQLRQREPAVAGLAALHVPATGIVNFRKACQKMAEIIRSRGGDLRFNFQVAEIKKKTRSLELISRGGEIIQCDRMINCTGLNCDRVCRMAGGEPSIQIVPFRGEYFDLKPGSESFCRDLIYPVPDPSFPFLGVHFTRMIDGGVECGPNAVLALSRKGYRWRDIDLRDLSETLAYKGFRSLASQHWQMGLGEMHRSVRKAAFVKALQKLIPRIQSSDLVPGRAGVRAQAVTRDGNLVDDFLFDESERAIHVLNAPSPAATASLAIAGSIADKFESSK